MTPIHIDKLSWHYRLAHTYGPDRHNYDICQYTRAVLRGSFLAFIVIPMISCLLLAPVVDGLAWLAACLTTGVWMRDPPRLSLMLVAEGFVLSGLGVLALVGYLVSSREDRRIAAWIAAGRPPLADEQPGMLRLMYWSFKEKFCVPIEGE